MRSDDGLLFRFGNTPSKISFLGIARNLGSRSPLQDSLEDKLLAPGTINVRLAAVRRFAYEVANTGLLSPDLVAGIRRVKGTKKLGMR